MANNRYYSLDSLRGIASLQVALGHFLVAIPSFVWLVYEVDDKKHDLWFYLAHSPVHFLWSASPAVIIFFVLSGFVLSLPFYENEGKKQNYLIFFFRRILRLYLPCIIIIIISIFLREILYQKHMVNSYDTWIKTMWSKEISLSDVLGIITLNSPIEFYIPASWTLPIEIKLSLILPLFINIQKKLNVVLSIILAISIPIICTISGKLFLYSFFPDWRIMFYFTFFIMGSTLCKYKIQVTNSINRLSNTLYCSILLMGFILFTIDYNGWLIPSSYLNFIEKIQQYIIAVSSLIFISFTLSDRSQKIMNSSILVFLGKKSFSLYLVHQLVLITLILSLGSFFHKNIVFLIFSLIISFIVAILFNKYVEDPTIIISRQVSLRINNFLNVNKYGTAFNFRRNSNI